VQAHFGLDGWFEAFCVDRAVAFVGGTIESALGKREEHRTLRGTKSVPVYKNIEAVFSALETKRRGSGAAEFIAMSKAQGRVTTHG
jgi:hypothetical protein